jgi:hypothetical protein
MSVTSSPEPSPQQPFSPSPPPPGYGPPYSPQPWPYQGPPAVANPSVKRTNRRNWIILGAVGLVALVVLTVTLATASTPTRKLTALPAATSAAPIYGNDWTPHKYSPAEPTTKAPIPAKPAETASCADSASWEQADGPVGLLDAYINNQDSGNINPDELKAGCPQYLPVWEKAKGGIPAGSAFAVPAEVKPGTYETTSADLEGCYWERSRNGQIQANNFITASKAKIRVTIRSGDDTFVTRDCGNWIKVG